MLRGVRRLALAFGVSLAGGCAAGPSASHGAERTLAALAESLRNGDAAGLAQRTGRSEADVTAALASQGAELHALGETLARTPVDTEARVVLTGGGTIVLVREGESWRVDRGVLGRPALARPVDAVMAFHDALARARIEGVLQLLARAPRSELELELAHWLDGTADPDALEISVSGEAATARTPTGEQIELVRESGEWRVVEIR
jgi:hypothetical protein